MKKLFLLLAFAVPLVGCTEKNIPDNGGNEQKNPGGGGSAKLKVYLIDIEITAREDNISKTINTYNDNDDLIRIENYQNGELNTYTTYTYSNNKRYGIMYYANGTIISYDTMYYNLQHQQEKLAVYYPDWTNNKWQVNTWEYSGAKMMNHKYYLDGQLKQNCDYTYNGNYRYGNTVGYYGIEENYHMTSELDTMYTDAFDRVVNSSRKSYSEGDGVTSVLYGSNKYMYLDEESGRYSSQEQILRVDWNINGNEYSSISSSIYEYTWINETTRYGIITITNENDGSISQSITKDTTYFHLKK